MVSEREWQLLSLRGPEGQRSISVVGEVVCLNEPLVDRLRMRVRGGGGEQSVWVSSVKPFIAKSLVRASWPFTVQPPLSFRPTTADDKDPAANYPADAKPLKWDFRSKGWPL